MTKHIISGLVWAVMFFATFPVIMVVLLSAVTTISGRHVDGRQGFLRDYYLISLPLMPGAAAFFAAGVGSMDGSASWKDWCFAAVVCACGIALFWTPPIRRAAGRLRAAARAAAAAVAPKADQ